MVKAKTSRRRVESSKTRKKSKTFSLEDIQPISLKSRKGLKELSAAKELQDEELIVRALLECLKENDSDGVIDVLNAHLLGVNKSEFAQEAGISRSTLYDILHGRKNPTLRVLVSCISEVLH
ncbi:MAG: hypothetical protein K940chlam2_00952 [Chlamydiae bacterium]|nr:hypothetical protein [Chlamydiota bacterium]